MAYNLYDGISDQVYCNSHPSESEALLFWVNILAFTPNPWEFDGAWRLWWSTHCIGGALRREVFESAYGFLYGERFHPIFQEMRGVTIIGASDYFEYLLDFVLVGEGDCEPLAYPFW